MPNSGIPEIAAEKVKRSWLIQFLTNLPEPISQSNLVQLQTLLGEEGCLRLREVELTARGEGRTTLRPLPASGIFIEEPLPLGYASAQEVLGLASFVLGIKRNDPDWENLAKLTNERFRLDAAFGVPLSAAPEESAVQDASSPAGLADNLLGDSLETGPFEDTAQEEAKLREDIAEAGQRAGQLRDELAQVRQLIALREEEHKVACDELDFLCGVCDSVEREKEELRRAVENVTNRIVEMRNQRGDLEKEMSSSEEDLKKAELDAITADQRISEDIACARARLAAAEVRNKEAEMFVAKAEQLEAKAHEKSADAEARIAAVKTADNAANEAIILITEMDKIGISRDLRDKLKPQVDETVRYQAAIYALSLIRESAIKLTVRVREEVRDLENKCRDLGQERSGLKAQYEESAKTCGTLALNRDDLQTRLDRLSGDIISLKQQTAAKEKELVQARSEENQADAALRGKLGDYRRSIEQLRGRAEEAEIEYERQRSEQEAIVARFEQMSKNAIAEADAKARSVGGSCAQRVAELERMAVDAKNSFDSESKLLIAAIRQSEEALEALKKNAKNRVAEAHNKAKALIEYVQDVQSKNLSGLQTRLEEMDQFSAYFDMVMVSLDKAKKRVDDVREKSESLNKTYQSLYAIRMLEAGEVDKKMADALATVDEICSGLGELTLEEFTEEDGLSLFDPDDDPPSAG